MSGYLVTRLAVTAAVPLLGTSVLDLEIDRHFGYIRGTQPRTSKCQIETHDVLALRTFCFHHARPCRDLIEQTLPTIRAPFRNPHLIGHFSFHFHSIPFFCYGVSFIHQNHLLQVHLLHTDDRAQPPRRGPSPSSEYKVPVWTRPAAHTSCKNVHRPRCLG